MTLTDWRHKTVNLYTIKVNLYYIYIYLHYYAIKVNLYTINYIIIYILLKISILTLCLRVLSP